jgi:catechol-2,3-dioxygenase
LALCARGYRERHFPRPEKVDTEVGGLCELVLETSDVGGMTGFYEQIGLRVLSRESDRVWLAAGERGRIGIWSPGEKEHRDRGGRHVHFALSLREGALAVLARRLRDLGYEVEGPIEHEGGDRSVYLFDPEGNRLELWDFFRGGGNGVSDVGDLAE